MSAPGPETRWFDIAGAREIEAAQLRNYRLVIFGILGLMVLGGIAAILWREGVTPLNLLTLGVCTAFSVAVFCVAVWFRNTRKPVEATIDRLGVARDGIWFTSVQTTSHVPWGGIGGVRIHSVVQATTTNQRWIYLDLLAANHPVIGRITPALQTGFQRVELGGSVPVTGAALGLAHNIGATIRFIRPDLWRGFTEDNGLGYIEFQSWETPMPSASENLRQLGADLRNPTWGNFGGNQHRPR